MSETWRAVTDSTWRLKVDGGHLYLLNESSEAGGNAMCFVPEIDLTRYEAHLRDAYKQGFTDGAVDAHAQYQKGATKQYVNKASNLLDLSEEAMREIVNVSDTSNTGHQNCS